MHDASAIPSTHARSHAATSSGPPLRSDWFRVITATGYVLFYALIAAASPLVLTATLVVIRSEQPRTNSIAFLTGFVVGTTIAAALGLILGVAAADRLDSHETLEGVLALLIGVALVMAGLRERHSPARPETEAGRGAAIMARLSHVRPGAVLSVGLLLGFGGPKRLILTFLAMASLSQADLRGVMDLTLIVLYVAVATLLVSVPVGIVVIGGSRAAAIVARGESWLKSNAVLLRVWLTLGLGVALIIDALLRLR